MQIYSMDAIAKHVKAAIKRFPLVCIDALFGTLSGLLIISDFENGFGGFLFEHKILMVCAIGFPLLLSVALFLESQKWQGIKVYFTQIVGIVFLLLYYFFLSGTGSKFLEIYLIRFALLFFSALILLMISPFLCQKRGSQIDFWQYNVSLLSRFIWTGIYSAILFIGLILSLKTIDVLFGAHFSRWIYFQVWTLVVGLVSTLFFLSGIPHEFNKQSNHANYSNINKIFAQHILLPLAVIYLAILYAYAVKILIVGQWPKGTVSPLVLSFSFIGIFGWFLGLPQILRQKGLWSWLLRRGFYIALIPLIIMLFFAVSMRVNQYGLTEKRCLIIILGFWLLGISLYLIWSLRQNIKIIFYSLFIVMLIAVFAAPVVSQFSQLRRLERFLVSNQILIDGKIVKTKKQVSFADRKNISSIIDYFAKTHGFRPLQKWFEQDLEELTSSENYYDQTTTIVNLIGLEYVE